MVSEKKEPLGWLFGQRWRRRILVRANIPNTEDRASKPHSESVGTAVVVATGAAAMETLIGAEFAVLREVSVTVDTRHVSVTPLLPVPIVWHPELCVAVPFAPAITTAVNRLAVVCGEEPVSHRTACIKLMLVMLPEASVEILREFSRAFESLDETVSRPLAKLYDVTVEPISAFEALTGSAPAVVKVPVTLCVGRKFAHRVDGTEVHDV